ncbi:hypothetical protein K438DRAFT_1974453 [Mycena galopus ATCC 62051]|nr:hypothetical protein K438DRAFT_1974453 [Mycena galopus ATCC 62051]
MTTYGFYGFGAACDPRVIRAVVVRAAPACRRVRGALRKRVRGVTAALKNLKSLAIAPAAAAAAAGAGGPSDVGASGTGTGKRRKGTSMGIPDCCICLFPVSIRQALFIAPCSHTFHYKCLRPLLEAHHPAFSCPLCRTFADLEEDVEVEAEEGVRGCVRWQGGVRESENCGGSAGGRVLVRSGLGHASGRGGDVEGAAFPNTREHVYGALGDGAEARSARALWRPYPVHVSLAEVPPERVSCRRCGAVGTRTLPPGVGWPSGAGDARRGGRVVVDARDGGAGEMACWVTRILGALLSIGDAGDDVACGRREGKLKVPLRFPSLGETGQGCNGFCAQIGEAWAEMVVDLGEDEFENPDAFAETPLVSDPLPGMALADEVMDEGVLADDLEAEDGDEVDELFNVSSGHARFAGAETEVEDNGGHARYVLSFPLIFPPACLVPLFAPPVCFALPGPRMFPLSFLSLFTACLSLPLLFTISHLCRFLQQLTVILISLLPPANPILPTFSSFGRLLIPPYAFSPPSFPRALPPPSPHQPHKLTPSPYLDHTQRTPRPPTMHSATARQRSAQADEEMRRLPDGEDGEEMDVESSGEGFNGATLQGKRKR